MSEKEESAGVSPREAASMAVFGIACDARPSPEEVAIEAIAALIVAANACPTIDDPRILLEHRPRVFSGDLAAALERVNALRGPTTPPAAL